MDEIKSFHPITRATSSNFWTCQSKISSGKKKAVVIYMHEVCVCVCAQVLGISEIPLFGKSMHSRPLHTFIITINHRDVNLDAWPKMFSSL